MFDYVATPFYTYNDDDFIFNDISGLSDIDFNCICEDVVSFTMNLLESKKPDDKERKLKHLNKRLKYCKDYMERQLLEQLISAIRKSIKEEQESIKRQRRIEERVMESPISNKVLKMCCDCSSEVLDNGL